MTGPDGSQGQARATAGDNEPTIGFLAAVLAANWNVIAAFAIAGLLLGIVAQLTIVPRHYDAQATIVPYLANRGQSPSLSLSNLAGFSAGRLLSESGIAISVANYTEILFSQGVLHTTLWDTISVGTGGDAVGVRIIDIIAPDDDAVTPPTSTGSTAGDRIDEIELTPRELTALRRLKRMISCSVNDETSAMVVRVSGDSPAMAAGTCRSLLENFRAAIVGIYNAQMESNLQFLQNQITIAEGKLRTAEDELVEFVEHNVAGTSASYRMRLDRFERRIAIHQPTYESLLTQYNDVAFEQKKSTPAFYVIENIVVPAAGDYRPKRKLVVAGAIIFALFLAMVWTVRRAAILWKTVGTSAEDGALAFGPVFRPWLRKSARVGQ